MIYLRGTGAVQVVGSDYSCNPFMAGNADGNYAVLNDSGIIRRERRLARENGAVIDVSGTQYFGVMPSASTGIDIAALTGDTYQNEETVYVRAGSYAEAYICEVPSSGKVFIKGIENYLLYTSDSYTAIERACAIRLAPTVRIEDTSVAAGTETATVSDETAVDDE